MTPVTLSTGRPRAASHSQRRLSQPLLASNVPAGWKADMQTGVGMSFESRFAGASGRVPEIDIEIVTCRCERGAVGAPRSLVWVARQCDHRDHAA